MSHWSDYPELLDQYTAEALIDKANAAPGECIINFGEGKFLEEAEYYWITKRFGEDFALSCMSGVDERFFDRFVR